MSLLSGILIAVCAILIMFLYLSIELHFVIRYQELWNVQLEVKIFQRQVAVYGAEYSLAQILENRTEQKLWHMSKLPEKIDRELLLHFGKKLLKTVSKTLQLKRLDIHCIIGFSRADYTAYGYGLFWAAASMLPERWLAKSSLVYIPDFQSKHMEIEIQGIIRCRIAQFIGMMMALFWVTVQMMLQQNRKEQIL